MRAPARTMGEAGADAGSALVDLVVEEPRWRTIALEAVVEAAARAALTAAGLDPDVHEVSILACDDGRIAALNAEFRGKAQPTNVLSWPAFDGPPPAPADGVVFLGDLALAYETCAAEAGEAGLPLPDHVAHLVVHGVLHLLGYDHEMEAEADAMEEFETKILASMGLPNPYSH